MEPKQSHSDNGALLALLARNQSTVMGVRVEHTSKVSAGHDTPVHDGAVASRCGGKLMSSVAAPHTPPAPPSPLYALRATIPCPSELSCGKAKPL